MFKFPISHLARRVVEFRDNYTEGVMNIYAMKSYPSAVLFVIRFTKQKSIVIFEVSKSVVSDQEIERIGKLLAGDPNTKCMRAESTGSVFRFELGLHNTSIGTFAHKVGECVAEILGADGMTADKMLRMTTQGFFNYDAFISKDLAVLQDPRASWLRKKIATWTLRSAEKNKAKYSNVLLDSERGFVDHDNLRR